MASSKGTLALGLEGVPVAETKLSHVDGAAGQLVLVGDEVERLAGAVPFEAVAARFWAGAGEPPPPEAVRAALGAARVSAHERLATLGGALEADDAMDALRAAVAQLREGPTDTPLHERGAHIAGAVAVFASAWQRARDGERPVPPDPRIDHPADFLRMLRGAPAAPREVEGLDAYMVAVIDHGLNASTFAARVVTSTGSDMVSAVTAAVGALKGPLHGGAPGPVLDMLDAVARPERARHWLEGELAADRRIMGMGHRIYRVRDPRAAVLETALTRLQARVATAGGGGAAGVAARLALARAVEHQAAALLAARHPGRPLQANVEFYTAVLLEALGVPRALFSAVFAAARTVGWTAHVDEERRQGRLIRPMAVYVGRMPVAGALGA